ncbi:hypothetical protein AB9K17_23850, partial [Salmonella enterica subsp. enterica serovar Kentucky]|uniref:hypothetical protein n=1 Tax=Salmonella enterica TaxID=28901 RepID=UPI003F4B82B6
HYAAIIIRARMHIYNVYLTILYCEFFFVKKNFHPPKMTEISYVNIIYQSKRYGTREMDKILNF